MNVREHIYVKSHTETVGLNCGSLIANEMQVIPVNSHTKSLFLVVLKSRICDSFKNTKISKNLEKFKNL